MTAFRFGWERALLASDLPSRARLVGMVMARYSDASGGSIFPGAKRLANDTALSGRTVGFALADLRQAGLVERVAEAQPRSGRSEVYRLRMPTSETASGEVTTGEAVTAMTGDQAKSMGEATSHQQPIFNNPSISISPSPKAIEAKDPWAQIVYWDQESAKPTA